MLARVNPGQHLLYFFIYRKKNENTRGRAEHYVN